MPIYGNTYATVKIQDNENKIQTKCMVETQKSHGSVTNVM